MSHAMNDFEGYSWAVVGARDIAEMGEWIGVAGDDEDGSFDFVDPGCGVDTGEAQVILDVDVGLEYIEFFFAFGHDFGAQDGVVGPHDEATDGTVKGAVGEPMAVERGRQCTANAVIECAGARNYRGLWNGGDKDEI